MPYNAPIRILCIANTQKWTEVKKIKILRNDLMLKDIVLWFSTSCSDKVFIRIKKNNTLFLPNQDNSVIEVDPADAHGFGPSYQGDDLDLLLNAQDRLKEEDFFTVEFVNTDAGNDHLVFVHMEFRNLPVGKGLDTEGTGTGRRVRTREEEETEMVEVGSGFGAQETSGQSPRGDRDAFGPIAHKQQRVGHPRADTPPEEVKSDQRYDNRRKEKYRPRYD